MRRTLFVLALLVAAVAGAQTRRWLDPLSLAYKTKYVDVYCEVETGNRLYFAKPVAGVYTGGFAVIEGGCKTLPVSPDE